MFACIRRLTFTLPAVALTFASPSIALSATGNCDLWDDEQSIPHIRAENDELLLACLGFVHARDRAWQLDFFRRTSQGRRSEVMGYKHLRSDFQMRILDLPSKAKALFDALPESDKRLWNAYSDGVNRGFASALREGVFEFKHWGYEPESWSPVDSLSLLLLQSFDQTRKTFAVQLDEERWIERHGTETTRLFLDDTSDSGTLPWDISILKRGEYPLRSPAAPERGKSTRRRATQLKESAPSGSDSIMAGFFEPQAGEGSNNWIIAPFRSKSGKALLANDPHLGLGDPPLWHISHIESPRLEAIGAAMPGIPVIVSGANRGVAWGLTNSYLEVARVTYVPESDLKSASVHRPWIWVKVWKLKLPYFLKTFRRTVGGFPVLPLETPPGKAMVLAWTGFDLQSKDLEGLFPLMTSRSARQTDQALALVGVPSWNFVFADTSGNIGYRAVGRIPRVSSARQPGIPSSDLRTLEANWKSKKSLEPWEMPRTWNPVRGYVVTANNRQWPKEAALHGGWAYSAGYRAFRIEELLRKEIKHDRDSFSRIQCDTQSVGGRFLAPRLLARLEKLVSASAPFNENERKAFDLLTSWSKADYQATLDCVPCGIFRIWLKQLSSQLLLDDAALYRKLTTASVLELDGALLAAYRASVRDFPRSPDGTFATWGDIHRNTFPHLGDETLFGNDGIATPGDDSSVNPGTSKWLEGAFQHTTGASQRLIVELATPPVIHSVLPGPNRLLSARTPRNLHSPDSPWIQWRDCRVLRRNFPLDWNAVPTTRLNPR